MSTSCAIIKRASRLGQVKLFVLAAFIFSVRVVFASKAVVRKEMSDLRVKRFLLITGETVSNSVNK